MSNADTALFRRNLSRSGRHTLAGDEVAARILASARKVMVDHGAGSFSVRKVAAESGVSLGHLQHYFPTRAALLNSMVISLEEDFFDHFVASISSVEDPAKRFVACAEYVLSMGVKHDLLPLLREFWAMAGREPEMAESLREFYDACRDFSAGILLEANNNLDREEARRRSCTAISLLSGAFLYLDPWRGDSSQVGFRNHMMQMMRSLPFDSIEPQRQTA